MLVALLVRCTPPPSRKKRRTTPTISIHNSRFHCYSPDDLTRRLRNLYTAGIYRSIRGATNLGVLCRKERYTMAVFSRYCPLYSPFPRSGEIILCARTKEIMLALLRSLPPSLSLAVNYSYLGERGRVSRTCPRDDKRAFVHYFIGVKRATPFSKMSLRIEPSRIVASQPASLSPALVHVGNDDPRGGGTIEIAILAPDIYRRVEDYSRVNKR